MVNSIRLLLLLPLCCYGDWLTHATMMEKSTQGNTNEMTSDDEQGQLMTGKPSGQPHGEVKSGAVSPCQPLNRFVSCYDVVVPDFPIPSFDANNPRLELLIGLETLRRRFRLRIHIDHSTLETVKPGLRSSSVMSASAFVQVIGNGSKPQLYHRDSLGVIWYIGHDEFEVAPSSVQATIVTNLTTPDVDVFRAVIHTAADVYYLEPASDYPQVITSNERAVIVYRRSDLVSDATEGLRYYSACENRSFVSDDLTLGARLAARRLRRGQGMTRDATCSLGIVVDHTFYQEIAQRSHSVAVSVVTQHIAEADFIFRSTDMDLDAVPDNIGFTIEHVTIYTSPLSPDYRMSSTTLDRDELMNALCSYNFNAYCLVVAFTFREFGDNIIGISWVPTVASGNKPGRLGGLCERNRYVVRSGNTRLPAGFYSLNVAMITQQLNGERIVDAVTSLTVTHELGHSFGALHDNDWPGRHDCMPPHDSPFGDYVMSARVDRHPSHPHNWMFSVCSRQSMKPVVLNRGWCLKPHSSTYCGNAIVERGEQCDCGTTYSCDVYDQCCTPLSLMPNFRTFGAKQACSLRGACSPKMQRCCSGECAVQAAGTPCRQPTDCTAASLCDGQSASCPAPQHLPNGTRCAGGRGQCTGGICSVSPCEKAGLVDCLCRRPLYHACSVCCRCAGASEDACVPARWLHLAPASYSLLLLPGLPCVGGGHCDNDARCVAPYYQPEPEVRVYEHRVNVTTDNSAH